jgi:ATP-dependent RNA helicase DDX27
MENQINRAEKMVKVKGEPAAPKRQWFQTHQERLDEKDRFKLANEGGATEERPKPKKKLGENQKIKRNERKKEQKKTKKKGEMTSEERTQLELKKVMLMQARAAKKMSKPKSMRLNNDVSDVKSTKAPVAKKSGSAFAADLTDTSQRSVKRLRYQGNVQNRQLQSKKGRKWND